MFARGGDERRITGISWYGKAADLTGDSLCGIRIEIVDDHSRAERGESSGHRRTDPRPGTGYHYPGSTKLHVRSSLTF
jgi:hypothetical protein